MAQEKLLQDLVDQCKALMNEAGYSARTLATYNELWEWHLKPFMQQKRITMYTSEVGFDFLNSLPGDKLTLTNRWRRVITIFDTVLQDGKIGRIKPQWVSFDMPGEIGEIAKSFLAKKKSQLVSSITVQVYNRMLGRLISFLSIKEVTSLSKMSEPLLLEFLSSSQSNPSQRVMVVRGFCQYLVQEGLVPAHYGSLVQGYRFPIREKLPSVYTPEEVQLIEKAINRNKVGGKRLYAMFLLAARLALRISDIIRLKLKNIDWDRNIVRIEQFKTGKVVELPLLVEVGNAIIDYLRSERPVCNDEHVFISLKPPFQRVSKDTVNTGFRKAFSDAGINAGRRHHGIHAMRHSLASELLSSQVPLPTISGILGHTSQTSTMNYLRVDIEAMKCCLLPVPPVPDEFYNQKGGILYE